MQVLGGIAMVAGTLDPLEDFVFILLGSGLVVLGMYLGGKDRNICLGGAGQACDKPIANCFSLGNIHPSTDTP